MFLFGLSNTLKYFCIYKGTKKYLVDVSTVLYLCALEMKTDKQRSIEEGFFSELKDTLFFQMHRIHSIMFRVANRKIKDASVPVKMEQIPILVCANLCGPVSQQGIANALQRDKSSVQRTINALCKKGLLEISTDPNDKRKKIIVITATGSFVSNQIKSIMRNVEEEMFEAFDMQEKEDMIASIAGTATKLENIGS